MAITIADFRARFPEFSDDTEFSDAAVQQAIDDATDTMASEANWCGRYDRAALMLAAHFLTLDTRAEAGDSRTAGTITSRSAGGVSVGYATGVRKGDEFLSSTVYGQRYIQLRNMCFPGVAIAR